MSSQGWVKNSFVNLCFTHLYSLIDQLYQFSTFTTYSNNLLEIELTNLKLKMKRVSRFSIIRIWNFKRKLTRFLYLLPVNSQNYIRIFLISYFLYCQILAKACWIFMWLITTLATSQNSPENHNLIYARAYIPMSVFWSNFMRRYSIMRVCVHSLWGVKFGCIVCVWWLVFWEVFPNWLLL
jgi:hypothetical protein